MVKRMGPTGSRALSETPAKAPTTEAAIDRTISRGSTLTPLMKMKPSVAPGRAKPAIMVAGIS
jgi:hypothetical protein